MRRPKPIKPFKTLKEEAKFWESYDIAALMENPKLPLDKLLRLKPEKQATMTLRLQRAAKNKLEKVAHGMGVNASTLARMWLVEKLQKFA